MLELIAPGMGVYHISDIGGVLNGRPHIVVLYLFTKSIRCRRVHPAWTEFYDYCAALADEGSHFVLSSHSVRLSYLACLLFCVGDFVWYYYIVENRTTIGQDQIHFQQKGSGSIHLLPKILLQTRFAHALWEMMRYDELL
jgi:hypothetical protein